MGRIFLEHMGGTRLFSCAKCDTNLTNRSELISTRFTGATGRAFLFNKVVNLTYSEVQDRVMLTGRHMVIYYSLEIMHLESVVVGPRCFMQIMQHETGMDV